jgi:hypothetical protein
MSASVVQSFVATSTNANVSTIAITGVTTAGGAIVVAVGVRQSSTTVTGVSDGHNTYALVLRIPNTTEGSLEIWATTNASPTALSSGTITATVSGNSILVARGWEISGGVNTGLFDQTNSGGNTSAVGSWATSATAGLAASGELALGVVCGAGAENSLTSVSSPAFTQGAESTSWPGSTTVDESNSAGNVGVYLHSGVLSITSTTGQAYTGTFGSNVRYSAFVGVFANPAVGSTVPARGVVGRRPAVRPVPTTSLSVITAQQVGQSTYRALLLAPRASEIGFVATRAFVDRLLSPPVGTPPSILRVKAPRVSVQQTVASRVLLRHGPNAGGVPKLVGRRLVQRPSVVAFRAASARIRTGLLVAQGQKTLRAGPTVLRPGLLVVRTPERVIFTGALAFAPPAPPAGVNMKWEGDYHGPGSAGNSSDESQ